MRRVFWVVNRVEAFVLSLAMLAIAAVTILNVLARNLLGRNFAPAEEINQFLIVLVTFVGLSYATSEGRHIRMTALYDALGRGGRKVSMIVISAVTAALLLVLARAALSYAWQVEKVSPVLGVPLWLVYLAAPLGLLLAAIQNALTLARNLVDERVFIAYDHTDGHEPDGADAER